LDAVFPDLAPAAHAVLKSLLHGDAIGLQFTHVWESKEGASNLYHGRILKKRSRKVIQYTIGYWEEEKSEEDCEDWVLRATELATDLVNGDLIV
jgi:hypothetical protein